MKNNLLIILSLTLSQTGFTQSQGGMEQYYYLFQEGDLVQVPMIHYQSSSNWYGEIRYNYEDMKTFSFYAGKVFSKESRLSYSILPILGGVMGKFNGGSVGLNISMDYDQLFFSTQSQCTFSSEDQIHNFFFSWSELGFQVKEWIYTGLAVQQTLFWQTSSMLTEPGIVVGFSFKDWTFPLYTFRPMSTDAYYVLGINWKWDQN